MSETREQHERYSEATRAMRPWGSVRERLRRMRDAFEGASDVVIWAEPIERPHDRVRDYEVKAVPASQFTGAHPEAVWE